jgi:hypothetical protein
VSSPWCGSLLLRWGRYGTVAPAETMRRLARAALPLLDFAVRSSHVVRSAAATRGGVGEVGLGLAGAEAGESGALSGVELAAVLHELEGAEPRAEGGEEAARADCGELSGIADEDRLTAGLVDQAQERGEHPRLRHPRFVDDRDGAPREAAVPASVEQEPMHGRAANAGGGGELVGRVAARCRPEHGDAPVGVHSGEDAESGRLAGAGDADDAHDPVGSEARRLDESQLLVRQGGGGVDGDLRRVSALAAERELERLPLDPGDVTGTFASARKSWLLRVGRWRIAPERTRSSRELRYDQVRHASLGVL